MSYSIDRWSSDMALPDATITVEFGVEGSRKQLTFNSVNAKLVMDMFAYEEETNGMLICGAHDIENLRLVADIERQENGKFGRGKTL